MSNDGKGLEFPDEMDAHQRLKALIAEVQSDEPDESIDRLTLMAQAVWITAQLTDKIVDGLWALNDRISNLEGVIFPLDTDPATATGTPPLHAD